MKLEEDYKTEKGSGHSTRNGYTVEARWSCNEPREICGQIFDDKWRKVSYQKSEIIGVPAGSPLDREIESHGLYSYPSAQALRWWLHAEADSSKIGGGLCLETRIIKHKMESSYKIEAISQHEHIGGDDRSNAAPDWGVNDD